MIRTIYSLTPVVLFSIFLLYFSGVFDSFDFELFWQGFCKPFPKTMPKGAVKFGSFISSILISLGGIGSVIWAVFFGGPFFGPSLSEYNKLWNPLKSVGKILFGDKT